ncbi:Alpha/beta hydrolase fold-3 domain-containing protein [Strongyloides ratti]|uniref:Alpha/beta hydrolase fold-3 domain-containing protein n=1 Tax=Strongyloides ratti TaxID=34506 RepID=A0A090LRV2_STRRB|nr:Alpha/beta hydrolase fold-3 domain-containing protein [Strongyloides ratti]CEF70311.1 Alpha/beta hydrolase fold-3 domain-containing protein [Strongyloides ratti]
MTILNIFRYVKLPEDVADEDKIKKYEITLRFAYEYPAKILEPIFHYSIHYKILRFISKIGEISKQKYFKNIQINNEKIGNICCRVYQKKEQSENAILYIHGGGFVALRPKFFDSTCVELAEKTNSIIFSVDYSLSPEAPLLCALDECYSVIVSLYENEYKKYNFNKNKIIIFGESAGGNLAAALSVRLVKRKKKNYFYKQILVNPLLSYINYSSPSHQIYKNNYGGSSFLSPRFKTLMLMYYTNINLTNNEILKIMKNCHVSKEIRSLPYISINNLPNEWIVNNNNNNNNNLFENDIDIKLVEKLNNIVGNPEISPILSDDNDLSQLPSSMIITCGIDILRDEGFLYKKRLETLGVNVTWKHYNNTIHGIISMLNFEMRKNVMNNIFEFIKD